MYLEVECRFVKPPSREDIELITEEILTKKLTNPDLNEDIERELLLDDLKNYDYGHMVINLSDVFSFNAVDDEHCTVRFTNGSSFTVRMSYNHFKACFNTVTQLKIFSGDNIIIDDE